MKDDPLQRFETEHEDALAALARLEEAALALRSGEPAGRHLAAVRAVHAILSGAVRTHNENEERTLFALLGEETPTALFIEEHRTLRALERDLDEACRGYDPERMANASLSIIDLLRAHIARENEVLFPMARERLGKAGLDEVARRLQE